VGIQTWYRKWKSKRELKKAVEKGKQQESTGTTSVPTTSGTISVPTTSTIAETYTSPTRTYSGGGGGSSTRTTTPTPSPTPSSTPTLTPTPPSEKVFPLITKERQEEVKVKTPTTSRFGISGGGEQMSIDSSKVTEDKTFLQKAGSGYRSAETFVSSQFTKPFIFDPLEKAGMSLTEPDYTKIRERGDPIAEFYVGAFSGIAKDIRDKPIKQVALVGAGYGLGFGLKGVSAGLSAIPKVGGGLAKGFKGAEIIGGTYLSYKFAKGTYESQVGLPQAQKGEIIGVALKDISLVGMGGARGQKGFEQTQGFFRTRGRTEIPMEQLVPRDVLTGEHTFPLAKQSAKAQLKMFETQSQRLTIKMEGYTGKGKFVDPLQVQQLPSKVPGMAFHSTGTKFWGDTLSVTQPGTSELPGLYGSYGISPHFLKVSGKGSYKIFDIKNIFQTGTKPGTASIIPKSFVAGKKAPLGSAYVPGIKTEVEAIFPVGTQAKLIDKSFFFKQKGVRIPLDVFKTTTGGTPTGTPVANILGSSSYGGLPSYSIIAPSSVGILGLSYSKPSYNVEPSQTISSYKKPSKVSSYKPLISSVKPSAPSSYKSDFISPKSSSPFYSPSSKVSYPLISKSSKRSYPPYLISSYKPKKTSSVAIPYLDIGWESPFSSQLAKRKFKATPSLSATLKYQLFGHGGGKTKESLARTGLVGRGFDLKVPKIKLGSLVGEVKKVKKKKKKRKKK